MKNYLWHCCEIAPPLRCPLFNGKEAIPPLSPASLAKKFLSTTVVVYMRLVNFCIRPGYVPYEKPFRLSIFSTFKWFFHVPNFYSLNQDLHRISLFRIFNDVFAMFGICLFCWHSTYNTRYFSLRLKIPQHHFLWHIRHNHSRLECEAALGESLPPVSVGRLSQNCFRKAWTKKNKQLFSKRQSYSISASS